MIEKRAVIKKGVKVEKRGRRITLKELETADEVVMRNLRGLMFGNQIQRRIG